MNTSDIHQAQLLDRQDELASYRHRFTIADPTLIYLDGNSLGRLPAETTSRIDRVVRHEWGERLIRSWNEGWMDTSARIGQKIARLIGARPDEVLVGDSTSVNLFKLVSSALLSQKNRTMIVTDDLNFPSDIYILQGICDLLGQQHKLEVITSADGIYGPVDQIAASMNTNTALLTLSHTTFKSSYTYDLPTMTEFAHDVGSLVLWDLSHSAGVVPIDLNKANVDLAVGCTYKYLNGGPGAPAFMYIRRDLQEQMNNPIPGWMGHQNIFDFKLDYQPAPGLQRFITGTPPIISLQAIEPGIDLVLEAGLESIRKKSTALSEYLISLWEQNLRALGFDLKSPIETNWRGSHISLGHEEGYRIDQALIEEMNVLPDFRHPDNIRLGLAPLYTSFEEVFKAAAKIREVVDKKLYKKYEPGKGLVT